ERILKVDWRSLAANDGGSIALQDREAAWPTIDCAVRLVRRSIAVAVAIVVPLLGRAAVSAERPRSSAEVQVMEEQITTQPHVHILTNGNGWPPASQWIGYDTRSDPYGDTFEAARSKL